MIERTAASTTIIALKMLVGNEPTHLTGLQLLLVLHLGTLETVWWGILAVTVLCAGRSLYCDFQSQKAIE
jgi:hypothetical protein